MGTDRNEFQSGARRTLLWCAIVLCASPLVGGWLIDHCPLPIHDPEAAATLSLWKKAKPHPDVLILGSSRLGSFVRTAELATTVNTFLGKNSAHIFNATLPFGEPITMKAITTKLLSSSSATPRLVVVETSTDLLARDNLNFKFVITRKLTASDLPEYIGDILLSHDGLSRLCASRLTPFFRHRDNFLAWAREAAGEGGMAKTSQLDETESIAWEGHSFQYVRDHGDGHQPSIEQMRAGVQRFVPRLRHYQLAGATSAAFEATVAMLHARGCAIVLVQPPFCSAQRALLTSEMRAQSEAFLSRLHTEYACEFVDYSEKLPDTLFVDYHHGTNAGSFRFTELLANEVVVPQWLRMAARTGE